MGILAYVILGIVLALLCWAAVKFVPMAPPWPTVLPTVAAILWVLIGLLAVLGGIPDYPLPRLR